MATESLILQLKARGVNLTKKQLDSLNKSAKKAGMSMKTMVAAVGGVYALGKAFSYVVGVGMKFSSAQSNLAAIVGKTKDQLGALDSTAKELGKTTKFTATQVVQLQTEYAKLGFTSEQIVAAQRATLALASAINVDLATAATVAGQTVNAFGLEAADTQRVVDVMALSFSSSALDMAKFTDSMTYVSAIAREVGFSVEATTGILGKLADVGISGSIAGTSLKNIFLKMGDASSDLSKKIGFQVKSDEDLFKALKKLNKEGMGLTEMMALTDVRSVATFSNMLQMAEGAETLAEALEGAAGAAQKMADEQMDNLEGDMLKLTSATEGFSLELYQSFEPMLRNAAQAMTLLVGTLNSDAFVFIAEAAFYGATAYVVWTVATGGLALAKLGLAVAIAKVKAAWIAFAASTGGTILALMAIGAILASLSGGAKEFSESVSISDHDISKAFSSAGQAAKHLSLESRRANIDLVEVQKQVQANVITSQLLSKEEYAANLVNIESEIKSYEAKTKKIDIVNKVVKSSATIYKGLYDSMSLGIEKSLGLTKTLKNNVNALESFNVGSDDAYIILKNLREKGLGNLVTGLDITYKKVGKDWTHPVRAASRDFRKLNSVVSGNIVNLLDYNSATSYVRAEMDANIDIFADNKRGLDNISQSLANGSSFANKIRGNFKRVRFEMLHSDTVFENANTTISQFNKTLQSVDTRVSRADLKAFNKIVDEILDKETGEIKLEYRVLVQTDREELQKELLILRETLKDLTKLQEEEAEVRLNKAKEVIGVIVDANKKKRDDALNTAVVVNIALAAEATGIEKVTQAHINYAGELAAETNILGEKLYTDDQIVQLLIASIDGTKELSLAQLMLNETKRQSENISVQEEAAITSRLLKFNEENAALELTAENIDVYIEAMKQAILEGKTLDEALESATGLDTEKTQEARERAIEQLSEYNATEMEVTLQHNLALILLEYDKQYELAIAHELGADELAKIQNTYNKKKKKLTDNEKKIDKERVQQAVDTSFQLIGAIAGYWAVTGKNADLVAGLQISEAIANTYLAASAAYANFGGWPGGIAPAAVSVVQGMASVAQIVKAREQAKATAAQTIEAEYGANFITNGLTNLVVGDNPGGRERVSVTPLSSPNMFGDSEGGGQNNISINIEGGLISSDFVENELAEKIADGVRRGVDFGIN